MTSKYPSILAFTLLLAPPALGGCAADATSAPGDAVADDSAAVRKSDLRKDLAKPGGPRGTPFAGRQEQPVAASIAAELKALADRCIEYREAPHVLLDTTNKCPGAIRDVVRDANRDTERATLRVGSKEYTVVFWDSERSDGGDMQDLAVYDGRERRIGLYRELFSRNDTVLDVFAAAFSNDTPVVRLTAEQYAEGILRGTSDDLEAVCARLDGGECTFAVDLYAPTEAQWQTFVASENPTLLAGPREIKAAMKECLFTTFAYTHYTPAEQETLASQLLASVSARSSTVDFYRGGYAWSYPGLDPVRTMLQESASVGGPGCSVFVKERGAPLFLSMASDVDD